MDSLAAADGVGDCCHQDNVYISQAEHGAVRPAWSVWVSSNQFNHWSRSPSKAHYSGRGGESEWSQGEDCSLKVNGVCEELSDKDDNLEKQRPIWGKWACSLTDFCLAPFQVISIQFLSACSYMHRYNAIPQILTEQPHSLDSTRSWRRGRCSPQPRIFSQFWTD